MTFILNFHGLGKCTRAFEEGEEPYWLDADRFERCLDIAEKSAAPVLLTFDDGNASDHDIALPILQQRGLGADFFVLAGKIGQAGYLSEKQVRAIDAVRDCNIGSHGLHHRAWPDLDDAELHAEIFESKVKLEAIVGHGINAAGLPFGRYDGRVLRALRHAGYTSAYSSDGGPRLRASWPTPRFSVRADTDIAELAEMIRASGSWLKRLRTELRAGIKSHR